MLIPVLEADLCYQIFKADFILASSTDLARHLLRVDDFDDHSPLILKLEGFEEHFHIAFDIMSKDNDRAKIRWIAAGNLHLKCCLHGFQSLFKSDEYCRSVLARFRIANAVNFILDMGVQNNALVNDVDFLQVVDPVIAWRLDFLHSPTGSRDRADLSQCLIAAPALEIDSSEMH